MAGSSKQQQLCLHVYNNLQSLSCPLVDGLFLRDIESMQQLLCTSSLHRLDILKWICVRICPSLRDKFSSIKSSQTDDLANEITQFGHELMLCKADDLDLIKGLATPFRQLLFLDQLLTMAQESDEQNSSKDESMRNEDLLQELMCPDNQSDLLYLMNPVCKPWSAHIQERLRSTQATRSKGFTTKANDSNNRSHPSDFSKLAEDDLAEATVLLQSTRDALEGLRKECEFLQSDPVSPGASLSPCALKVAISDMAQLMNAFSQIYNTDFKGYCQRARPVLNPSASVFQSVHQLLHSCNMELEALQQLSETSSVLTETVKQIQTEKRFWNKGEKRTLCSQLESMKNKYGAFLSHYQKSMSTNPSV